MGILTTLLIGIFLAFPLGVVIRIQVGPSAYVYPIDVFLLLLFLVSLYEYVLGYKKIFKISYTKPLIYFIGVGVVSLVINLYQFSLPHVLTGSLYLVRFVVYANLLFVPFLLTKKITKKMFMGLIISIFFTVGIGFIQYLYYPNLRNLYYLGWDEHLYRLFSSFLDPNFAGVIFVILFLSVMFVYQAYALSPFKRILVACMGLSTLLAVFLTYSRGAYVILLFSVFLYFIFSKQKKLIFASIIVFLISIVLLPKNFGGEGVKLLRTASIGARATADRQGLTVFMQNPILGVGFDTYRYAQQKKGFLDKSTWLVNHAGAGVPNSYLFILATTGIAGFFAYVYFWIAVIKTALTTQKDNGHESLLARAFFLSAISGVLVDGFFDNILFYPSLMIILFLIIAWYFVVYLKSGS